MSFISKILALFNTTPEKEEISRDNIDPIREKLVEATAALSAKRKTDSRRLTQPAKEIEVFHTIFSTEDAHLIYFHDLKDFFEECHSMDIKSFELFRDKILRLMEKLYNKYILNTFYFNQEIGNILEYFSVFEPILFYSNPKYRDHFIHQFWVFAIGSCIINHKCAELRKQYIKSLNIESGTTIRADTLDYAWLLTGTMHDFAYPLEQIDKWLFVFFKQFFPFKGEGKLFNINLEKLLSESSYLEKINCLSSLFNSLNSGTKWCSEHHDKYKSNYHLTEILYKRLTHFDTGEKFLKPHALLSALSLLTKFSHSTEVPDDKKQYIDPIIYPSALAIAMHHLHPWGNCENCQCLGKLSFSKNILTYLLIFADSAQEWYRLSPDNVIEASLEKISFENNKFIINLDWDIVKGSSPGVAGEHVAKLEKHIEFLRKIPGELLENDMKKVITLSLSIKAPWKRIETIEF